MRFSFWSFDNMLLGQEAAVDVADSHEKVISIDLDEVWRPLPDITTIINDHNHSRVHWEKAL